MINSMLYGKIYKLYILLHLLLFKISITLLILLNINIHDILVNYNNIKYIKCFKIYNALSNII